MPRVPLLKNSDGKKRTPVKVVKHATETVDAPNVFAPGQNELLDAAWNTIPQEVVPKSMRGTRRSKKMTPRGLRKGITVYNPTIHPAQLYRLRILGLPIERVADVLMISPHTLIKWRELYPEFQAAWVQGAEEADAAVAYSLYRRALGWTQPAEKIAINTQTGEAYRAAYTERFAPDVTAAIHWLNNRQGARWKSKVNNELTGADGQPLTPPSIIVTGVVSQNQQAPIIEVNAVDVDADDDEYAKPLVEEKLPTPGNQ